MDDQASTTVALLTLLWIAVPLAFCAMQSRNRDVGTSVRRRGRTGRRVPAPRPWRSGDAPDPQPDGVP